MKKTLIIAIGIILMISQALWAETIDLDKFLDLVKLHSKDLKLAAKEQEMADQNKKEAISTALPKVSFQADYTRNLTNLYMYADLGKLFGEGGGVTKFKINRNNEYSATAALQQTLFSATVGNAIKAARQYEQLTNNIYIASLQKILAAAKKMFYQTLLLDKFWQVNQAAEQNALDNYESMKLKFKNGFVSEFELLQAEVRWKNSIPETAKAKRNYELALNNLKNWAGIPVENELILNGNFDEYPVLPDTVLFESILKNRPDFNALLWEEQLRKTNVSAKRAAYYPTLTGIFAYNYSAQSDHWKLEQDNNLYFAGVNLTIPIFTGGYLRAEVNKAQIEVDKTRVTIEKTKEDIYNEVTNVYLRLKEAHERISSAEATLKTAKKAFKIAENTAKSGLATQLQLKDARMGFDMANMNYYSAIFDYLAAYFDWQETVGKGISE